MRKGLTKFAASAMSVCLLASAAPAAMYAEAAGYPGDSAVSAQGCQYTPARGGSRPWVSISYDYNARKMWMVDKSRKIRVIKGDWTTYRGMPGTEYARPSSDKDPLNQQPNWDRNAEMMHNVEKVYDFYKNKLNHYDFNFAGGSDQNIYVYSFPNPGDARAHVIDDIGSPFPNKMNWVAFGEAGPYTYCMGSDLGAVGHEFTHLVTAQRLGWLPGMNTETDALMEAYSDILGELCEANPDWKVAADAFKGNTAANKRYSYRDLTNPSATNDPIHGYIPFYSTYSQFQNNRYMLEHNNPYNILPCYLGATVVGHAAYLMYQRGIQKEELAKIWYNSLNYYFGDSKKATFTECRYAVIEAARALFGNSSSANSKVAIVAKAFDDCGIKNRTDVSQATSLNGTHQTEFIRYEGQKFLDGRYWNAGDPNTTSRTSHGTDHTTFLPMGPTVYRNFSFLPWQTEEEYFQCAGFAKKLQEDFFGTDTFVQDSNINYTPSFGDHLRVKHTYRGMNLGEHSVFIRSVNGNELIYSDCNSDGNNIIRWTNRVTYSRDSSGRLYYTEGQDRYEFEWVERPIMQGDCNADGVLNSADVTAMNSIINNTAPTYYYNSKMRKIAADLNSDGVVNASDRTILNDLINYRNNARYNYGYIVF